MAETDPLEGLPDDLVRLLRNPSIIIPQDAAVFNLIAKWMDAPSDTASAMSVDEWREAWIYSTRKWRETEAELSRLVGEHDTLRMTVRAVNDNALGWHAGEDGKARALNVIAVWTSEALAGRVHPSVAALAAADSRTESAALAPAEKEGGNP